VGAISQSRAAVAGQWHQGSYFHSGWTKWSFSGTFRACQQALESFAFDADSRDVTGRVVGTAVPGLHDHSRAAVSEVGTLPICDWRLPIEVLVKRQSESINRQLTIGN